MGVLPSYWGAWGGLCQHHGLGTFPGWGQRGGWQKGARGRARCVSSWPPATLALVVPSKSPGFAVPGISVCPSPTTTTTLHPDPGLAAVGGWVGGWWGAACLFPAAAASISMAGGRCAASAGPENRSGASGSGAGSRPGDEREGCSRSGGLHLPKFAVGEAEGSDGGQGIGVNSPFSPPWAHRDPPPHPHPITTRG